MPVVLGVAEGTGMDERTRRLVQRWLWLMGKEIGVVEMKGKRIMCLLSRGIRIGRGKGEGIQKSCEYTCCIFACQQALFET